MHKSLNYLVEEVDTHSAIPTWSGFDYQGQVSIYWVIRELNEMDLSNVQLEDYELQIESLEDFSINLKVYPITIHQVKAYRGATFSKYRRAIHDLLGKCAKYPLIKLCYLHTLEPFNIQEKDLLKNELQGIQSSTNKEQLEIYKNLLFNEGKYDEVHSKLVTNITDNNELKCVIGRMEIESEIKNQIKIFLRKNKEMCSYEFVESEENINFIYLNFIHEINQVVARGHEDKKKNITISFLFSSIFYLVSMRFIYWKNCC